MQAATEILNRKNAEASPFLIAEYEYTQHRYYFPQCGIQMRRVPCEISFPKTETLP
jgi:hypothetical protein